MTIAEDMNIYFVTIFIRLSIFLLKKTDLFWYIILHIFQGSFEYALGFFTENQNKIFFNYLKVNRKAMIMNLYNLIPHPIRKIKRERNTSIHFENR